MMKTHYGSLKKVMGFLEIIEQIPQRQDRRHERGSRWFLKPPILGNKTIDDRGSLLDPISNQIKSKLNSLKNRNGLSKVHLSNVVVNAIASAYNKTFTISNNNARTGYLARTIETSIIVDLEFRCNGCNPTILAISKRMSERSINVGKLLTEA
ncbi:hypothetical protein V6N11_013855 [Hibiscus sabdariffa]|uniref:Uncharacterized protein n=2 Tax=Hibiscus sabdariffa TaxID=183260 RepID=A0ABR2NK57_9ROSI